MLSLVSEKERRQETREVVALLTGIFCETCLFSGPGHTSLFPQKASVLLLVSFALEKRMMDGQALWYKNEVVLGVPVQ